MPRPRDRVSRAARVPAHRGRVLGPLALVVLVMIAYWPALHGGYVWDDQDYVVKNSNLVRPDGLRRIWFEPRHTVQYYPLVHTVLRAEYRAWQLRPRGYHLVNVLLHAANAALVWVLLQRLAVPGAWLAAAVFAVHPLQVESVAWITEIKNLLSGLFALLSALAWLRFQAVRRRAGPQVPGAARRAAHPWRAYALSLVCFVLALLSKTTVVVLPAVFAMLVWWKSAALRRRDLLPLVPMLVLAAAFGAFTWWLETYHVGSEKVVDLSLSERLLLPARVAAFYLGKLLWPADLAFIYPRWHVDARVWWQYLYPLAAIAVVAILWGQRRHLGKGPLAAILIDALLLAPASGEWRFYFQLYSFVGDHFQYLASIPVAALVVAGVTYALRRITDPRLRIVLERGAPAVLLVVLVAATWSRARVFENEATLWADTLAKNPGAWIAHNNLGVVAMRQGRKDEATARFLETLKYNPRAPEAHANLGLLYAERGDTTRAIDEYSKALAIKPVLYDTQYNLGLLLLARGEMLDAARCFEEALRSKPTLAEAHMKLGDIHAFQGQLDQAAVEFRAALALDPKLAAVYYRLGWVLNARGAHAEARDALATAVRMNPGHAAARAQLGVALENLGDRSGALAQYRQALEMNGQNQLASDGLKRLASTGTR